MDFGFSDEQKQLQERCRVLAADFALRSAEHDRDASHPIENYRRLAWEGFLELTVPREWGGAGLGLLDHTIAFEALVWKTRPGACDVEPPLSSSGPCSTTVI